MDEDYEERTRKAWENRPHPRSRNASSNADGSQPPPRSKERLLAYSAIAGVVVLFCLGLRECDSGRRITGDERCHKCGRKVSSWDGYVGKIPAEDTCGTCLKEPQAPRNSPDDEAVATLKRMAKDPDKALRDDAAKIGRILDEISSVGESYRPPMERGPQLCFVCNRMFSPDKGFVGRQGSLCRACIEDVVSRMNKMQSSRP